LSNANTAQPIFRATPGASNDTVVLQLVVNDGTEDSPADDVRVVLSSVEHVSSMSNQRSVFSEGSFFGQLHAVPGERHVVEASTNLQSWISLATNTVDFLGLIEFIDADLPNFPYRFYRSIQK
jgi:hypothetical protein